MIGGFLLEYCWKRQSSFKEDKEKAERELTDGYNVKKKTTQ